MLEKFLATVLVELLRYVQSREDLKELVREKILSAGLQSANDALGWKETARDNPKFATTLRVRDHAVPIVIPPPDAPIGSLTVDPRVLAGGSDTPMHDPPGGGLPGTGA